MAIVHIVTDGEKHRFARMVGERFVGRVFWECFFEYGHKIEKEYFRRHVTLSYVEQLITKFWVFHMDQHLKIEIYMFARNLWAALL